MLAISGLGLNVHRERLPLTDLGRFSWIRVDSETGPYDAGWFAARAAQVQHYRNGGKKIVFLLNPNMGSAMASIAREVQIQMKPDMLTLPNEPDQVVPVTPAAYADMARSVKQGLAHLDHCLGGPELSTWDDRGGGNVEMWWDPFVAAGGLQWLDVITIHPYHFGFRPPEAITAWTTRIAALTGKPIVYTELGESTLVVEALTSQPWNAAKSADLYMRAYLAGGKPLALYDGPNTGDGMGMVDWINDGGTGAPLPLLQEINNLPASNHVFTP